MASMESSLGKWVVYLIQDLKKQGPKVFGFCRQTCIGVPQATRAKQVKVIWTILAYMSLR